MTSSGHFRRRWTWTASVCVLAISLAGCSGNSGSQQAGSNKADGASGQPGEQADAPESPLDTLRKKNKNKPAALPLAAKAAPAAPAASSKKPDQWEIEDLQAALKRLDPQFALAVVLFGVRHAADAKGATALDSLVQQVAKLKDDPSVTAPLQFSGLARVTTLGPMGPIRQAAGIPPAGAAAGQANPGQPKADDPNSMRGKRRRRER